MRISDSTSFTTSSELASSSSPGHPAFSRYFSRVFSLVLVLDALLSLDFSFVCLKHKNSMPVARRVSARVFFTPSRWVCRFSSPGRRAYACEILVYRSERVWSADEVT